MHKSKIDGAASSRRWAASLTGLVLLLQVSVALALDAGLRGKEIASDITEYHLYVENPLILLNPPADTEMNGGWVAAPLLPLQLAPIYSFLKWLGATDFLAFRGTMICWTTVGFGLTLAALFRCWGPPRTPGERWLAIALTCWPLTWFPSAVLAQDECLAAAWCGIIFYCWSRWGIWACWTTAAVAVFAAKPFFLVYFAALWMAYPAQRKTIFLATCALFLSLLGFMFWRDGQLRYFRHGVQTYMSGSLYSLAWLWDHTYTLEATKAHRLWASRIATLPSLIAMAGYGLLALRVRFTLPSALVGLYCVMFTFLVGMMPEYELWYWSWAMMLIWIAFRHGERLLAALLFTHSVWGYAYKVLYSCDSRNFLQTELKPTAIWYDRHIGMDLRLVLMLLSAALVINTLWLAILLWRKYPQLVAESTPATA